MANSHQVLLALTILSPLLLMVGRSIWRIWQDISRED